MPALKAGVAKRAEYSGRCLPVNPQLERFRAKWMPVGVKKTRQNKD